MSKTQTPLLQVRNLKTYFKTEAGWAKAVDGVSFDIYARAKSWDWSANRARERA